MPTTVGSFGAVGNEVAKTANYTILSTDRGNRFTNAGATAAVQFKLPAIGVGLEFEFLATVAQNFSITSNEGTNILFDGTATANTIAFQTPGNIIGGHLFVYANVAGTQWYCEKVCSNAVTQT